jgi:hypothetical protein
MESRDPRYHPTKWRHTANFTRALTNDRCCLCLRKAAQVHHAYYGLDLVPWLLASVLGALVMMAIAHRLPLVSCAVLAGVVVVASCLIRLKLPIPGFEMPFLQIFPLCLRCHSNSKNCAHNFSEYLVSRRSNWLNRNRDSFLWRLRLSMAIAFIALRLWWAIGLGLVAVAIAR